MAVCFSTPSNSAQRAVDACEPGVFTAVDTTLGQRVKYARLCTGRGFLVLAARPKKRTPPFGVIAKRGCCVGNMA